MLRRTYGRNVEEAYLECKVKEKEKEKSEEVSPEEIIEAYEQGDEVSATMVRVSAR